MRPKIAASPPKRNGRGECGCAIAGAGGDNDGLVPAFIALTLLLEKVVGLLWVVCQKQKVRAVILYAGKILK